MAQRGLNPPPSGALLLADSAGGAFDRAADLAAVFERRGRAVRVLAADNTGAQSLRRHLLDAQPAALLHCFGDRAARTGCLASLGTGIPVVVSLDCPPSGLTRAVLRRARFVIAASHDLANRCGPETVLVIPNAVDTDRFRPGGEGRERVRSELGVAGAFAWLCGEDTASPREIEILLRAFARSGGRADAILVLAGWATQDSVRALADELGVAARVRFNPAAGIAELMAAADAYVSPARVHCPVVELPRAASSGLPVAATMSGGNSEAVLDGWSGFLAPPGSPEALGDVMDRIESMSAGERTRMGLAGRAYCMAVNGADHIARRWEKLYLESLPQSAPSHWLRANDA